MAARMREHDVVTGTARVHARSLLEQPKARKVHVERAASEN